MTSWRQPAAIAAVSAASIAAVRKQTWSTIPMLVARTSARAIHEPQHHRQRAGQQRRRARIGRGRAGAEATDERDRHGGE